MNAGSTLFSQGDAADCVFFLQSGRAKLIALSSTGKEAIITLTGSGDFVGEESLSSTRLRRITTAIAVSPCLVVRIERQEMIHLLRTEQTCSEAFLKFLLLRNMMIQNNLVDHMFNRSEKRLARILLSMAEFALGETTAIIPRITQKDLAEMVGTTRSRISFFMNRFRELGFIDYNGRIHVNRSLRTVVEHDC